MNYLYGYLIFGFIFTLPFKDNNHQSVWFHPTVLLLWLFWPIFIIYYWANFKRIKWRGKVLWERK